jgi:hypothetical protein
MSAGFCANTAANVVGPQEPTIINGVKFALELFVKILSL